MRKILMILFVAACAFFTGRFALKQTDGFTVERIRSERPFDKRWESRPLNEKEEAQRNEALLLKYRYYGKGGQSYIFFSEGEQYVLKFFRQKVYRLPFYIDYLPSF